MPLCNSDCGFSFCLEIPASLMVGVVGLDGVGQSALLELVASSKKMQQGNARVLDGDSGAARHRRAVCPRYTSVFAIINQITLLTIVLTGATVIRQRKHGTLEHLLVMPRTAFQIAMVKVLANG